MLFLALIAGTLASEDLTCIYAALLIQEGRIGFLAGIAACAIGIVLGDVGLWAAGRLTRTAIGRWPVVSRYVARLPVNDMRRWLDDHAALAMFSSRFTPGTRLPLYVCAGIVGMSFRRFTTWASMAALAWTPILIWLAAVASDAVLNPIVPSGQAAWATRLAFAGGLFMLIKLACRRLARAHALTSRLGRWARWEFWPMWLFYAPVALWVLWLSVRHRGISTITASNPGIPDGGVVGESKFHILSNLLAEWTVPSALMDVDMSADRARQILDGLQRRGWSFPIVLKPDVGQRGVGVRLARRVEDVEAYCAAETGRILVQPYHPGPFEAGIFYYRFPGEPRGRIFSVTDKHFPVIIGDGHSTIEALIWAHPRYCLQAGTFLTRHRSVLARVLARGERFQLAIAGNHAQGTLFCDGWHLWTPALEMRIDEIARAFRGFYVGRFDVRYRDVAAFRRGEDLAIVELNGATAESTDIYDPKRSLFSAYRKLFTQWSIVFAIGAANRATGARVTATWSLLRLIHEHTRSTPALGLSD
jgi:membrane protein DedA with SNARE-associated domain